MILVSEDGLVVAAGNITADRNFYYCQEFAFPANQNYKIYDNVALPSEMRPWNCTYKDGVFEEIINDVVVEVS